MLQINLLGDFKLAFGDAAATSLKSPRVQALFAYLLLHRDAPQSRQRIAFLFWPDSSENQAQTNLRKLIVSLRSAFPEAGRYIAVDRHTLQWRNDSPYTLDVSDFEKAYSYVSGTALDLAPDLPFPGGEALEQIRKLRAAVDLYTGDLLPGCYEEWIAAPRERLRQAHLETLQRLVRALQAAGEIGSAILYAQRLLRHDPFQEENYRRLMHLYLANGDGAAAIAVYRQCEAFLKRELGVQPSPATVETLRQVEEMRGSPAGEAAKSRERRPRAGGRKDSVEARDTPDAVPNNVPAPTTLFIGREQQVSLISELLTRVGVRLVTLTGAAGTGKTRLALQVAAGLVALLFGAGAYGSHPFADGIFFVPLASVDDPDLVPSVIARVLGVAEAGAVPVIGSLIEYLRDKALLLVLDNFEHLLGGSSLVAAMLSACPRLKVLVTSQAVLNISGEREFTLSPMHVPSKDLLATVAHVPDDLLQFESVALFVERAREASPGFALTRSNARAVAEICRKLEGLPLALELAAARLKVLSPEAVLSRLDRRLKLLVGGRADLPPRQRALATAIEWSYNLLEAEEKRLFQAMSVFAGGFSLDAATAVSGRSESEVLEGITSLLNKSLLSVERGVTDPEDANAERRFAMLETLREFGYERLRESAEVEELQQRHALYYLALAESAEAATWVSEQAALIGDRLDEEQGNLRAALAWACSKDKPDLALRLSSALGEFWQLRGHWAEGRVWLDRALNLRPAEASPWRSRALLHAGRLAARQRDSAVARDLLEECRALCRASGDEQTLGAALGLLAVVALEEPDYEGALEIHAESLALHRKLGDKWRIASSLHNMSFVKMLKGDLEGSRDLSLEAQSLFREAGAALGIGFTHYVLGNVSAARADHADALAHLREAERTARQIENQFLLASSLLSLSEVSYRQGHYEQAEPPLLEAWQLYADLGDGWGLASALLRMGRAALNSADYEAASAHFTEALTRAIEMDHDHLAAFAVAGIARIASAAGRLADAVRLYSRAQTLSPLVFASSPIAERPLMAMTPSPAEARTAMGDEAWRAAWAEGATISDAEVLEIARTLP